MLTALETGVKGGKWFSLVDKVYAMATLRRAWEQVRANHGAPGVDRVTVEQFDRQAEANLQRLAEQLRDGTYRPQAVRRVWIDKIGSREKRPLGIPTVRDRVVQAAIRMTLEPIFESAFAERSYGFRPGRCCQSALAVVDAALAAQATWVVDADIKGYFDSIPHEPLLARVRERVADGRVLTLLEAFLAQDIFENLRHWTPEQGTPQGAVISPLLANLYLDRLDHAMAAAGFLLVRYADDFVVLCRSEAEAQSALEMIRRWTDAAGLTLHPDKTRIVDATQRGGFDFLGYHFERGKKWPRKKSLGKIREKIRAKTHRANGHSLDAIIADLNPMLRGWYAYFRHSTASTFRALDGWTRNRLRGILRKRRKLKGRARGADYQRWPVAFFAAHGLFSLTAAHAAVVQSSER